VAFLAPVTVGAQTQTEAKKQICEGIGGCDTPGDEKDVNDVVNLVVNVLSTIVAIASVIVIIFAGFRYVIAAGDSSKISSAKDTIVYAIVGLIIVALAQVIVKFVINRL
jgi:hypothetical protein